MCAFEGSERSIHDLKLSFFQTLFVRINASSVFTFNSLADLLDSCTFHALYFYRIANSLVHCCVLWFFV